MILILTGAEDMTTLAVIQWLRFLKQELMVISDRDVIDEISIINFQTHIRFTDQRVLDFSKVTAYWYRRGNFNLETPVDKPESIGRHLKNEMKQLVEILHRQLLHVPNLSSDEHSEVNRINVMLQARNLGFKLPDFGIFNTRTQVAGFLETHGKIVTKPLSDGLFISEDQFTYAQYTSLFEQTDLERLPPKFLPGLFAAYIEKKYELRIFYLNGQCYTMAILSQQDEKTKVDMRQYNYQKPNRNVPYQLPEALTRQITLLMQQLQLKTGSIDMIVDHNDQFIFLEVNPIGQFGNLSANCNYHLEYQVADYLTTISAQS